MSSTKFVVVKAKELIKTAVFAVLGVIILIGLITFFLHLGEDTDSGSYRDGTYYSQMTIGDETAQLAVTVADGQIASVTMDESSDAAAVFYPLLETALQEVNREVVRTQSLTIEVSPQNVHSAMLLLDAVGEGLELAKR